MKPVINLPAGAHRDLSLGNATLRLSCVIALVLKGLVALSLASGPLMAAPIFERFYDGGYSFMATDVYPLFAAPDGALIRSTRYSERRGASGYYQNFYRITSSGNESLVATSGFVRSGEDTLTAIDGQGRIHGIIGGRDIFSISPGEANLEKRSVFGVPSSGDQLLAHASGDLYFLTSRGLYKIPPEGSAILLDDFTSNMNDSITWGPDGAIYGVSSTGGAFGTGRLYRCTTNGEVSTLYDFGDPINNLWPRYPYGTVTFGEDGSIYGVAYEFNWRTDGAAFVYTKGTVKAVALFGQSSPLAPGPDGRMYGIRQVQSSEWNSTIEILRFEPNLSFSTIPVSSSTLASLPTGRSATSGFTSSPDGSLYLLSDHSIYRLRFGQPVVALSPISDLTPNGVVLHGTVTPQNDPNVISYIEWGASESELRRMRTPPVAGEGSAVSLEIHGLQPDTQYFYRLRSSNSGGFAQTSVATFRTPPGNKLPQFKPFLARTTTDTPTVIPMSLLLAAMSDPDGGVPSIATVHPTSDRGGSAFLNEESGLNYLPPAGFRGMDAISVDMIDSQGGRVTVFFPIEVVVSLETDKHADHIGLLSGGQLLIVLHGEAGKAYNLHQSSDLINWTAVFSQTTGADGSFLHILEIPPKTTTFYELNPNP